MQGYGVSCRGDLSAAMMSLLRGRSLREGKRGEGAEEGRRNVNLERLLRAPVVAGVVGAGVGR